MQARPTDLKTRLMGGYVDMKGTYAFLRQANVISRERVHAD